MKRLLFVPFFGALAWLGSCSYHFPHHPTPAEIIQTAHGAFPSYPTPTLPQIVVPNYKPTPIKRKTRVRHISKDPDLSPPPVPYVPEELPPIQVHCLFPFSVIPGCYIQ